MFAYRAPSVLAVITMFWRSFRKSVLGLLGRQEVIERIYMDYSKFKNVKKSEVSTIDVIGEEEITTTYSINTLTDSYYLELCSLMHLLTDSQVGNWLYKELLFEPKDIQLTLNSILYGVKFLKEVRVEEVQEITYANYNLTTFKITVTAIVYKWRTK